MRILHCMNNLYSCLEAEGDVIECGVASGANTFPLADMVKTYNKQKGTNKRVFACDTFSGMPYDDSFKEGHKAGELNYGLNFKLIQAQRKDLPITRIEGLVEESLPNNLSNGRFCFVFLDMDLYEPTRSAFLFLKDKISIGGIIGFHDYEWHKCPGVKKVIDEHLDKCAFSPIMIKDYTIFFKKVA